MCGVIGIVLADLEAPVAPELCDGCLYLQHRGQDAAGIATCGDHGRIYQCKGNGLAREVFTEQRVASLVGSMGIGHLRYPTAGSCANSEAQPFYVNSPYGINLGHNGNLINTAALRKYLDERAHRHINTDSDSELLLNIFASELERGQKFRVNNEDVFRALEGVYRLCRGGYACVGMLAGFAMFGFRDANGIRPLLYGERPNGDGTTDYMLASESVVLKAHGFVNIRDIKPGEAVIVPRDCSGGKRPEFRQVVPMESYRPDIFEYVYFARPDSVLDGISVYHTRLAMGAKLAENIKRNLSPNDIDVVVCVPDTARTCALECANALEKPYREGFVKNRYVGRTFIMPNQQERVSSVRRKLNPMDTEFKGKNVLIVDDSIVRGTTSKEIVSMAREAGARKVYFASAAPAIRYNHIYGIDLADSKKLIAYNKTEEEVATALGCDKVIYQNLEDLIDCCKNEEVTEFEIGVLTGEYVTGIEEGYLSGLERTRAQNREKTHVKSEVDVGLYNPADY